MRIALGVGGEVIGAPTSPQDIVNEVVRAEADGCARPVACISRSAWMRLTSWP
jgi:hypothetical protein